MILGIEDPWVILGYSFAIGLTLVCIIYGLQNWYKANKGAD